MMADECVDAGDDELVESLAMAHRLSKVIGKTLGGRKGTRTSDDVGAGDADRDPEKEIQELLGHASSSTTKVYAELAREAREGV